MNAKGLQRESYIAVVAVAVGYCRIWPLFTLTRTLALPLKVAIKHYLGHSNWRAISHLSHKTLCGTKD